MQPWFERDAKEVIRELGTHTKSGLTEAEFRRRLTKYGPNSLPEASVDTLWQIFFRQFQNPLIYILLIAAIVVFFLNDITDSLTILAVLVFNAVIGAFQEGRAQNTLKALRQLTDTEATVIREGETKRVPDRLLVPGDIIILHEGEKVPADARLIEVSNLAVDESTLTGEVIPVHKLEVMPEGSVASQPSSVSYGDQRTMIFKGTYITGGNGLAVVVSTGKNSELGAITQAVETINTEIPLQTKIRQLVRVILIVVAVSSVAIFLLGISRGYPMAYMFAIVVSLAVSAIPEGLPVVLTVVLATGLWRMSKRNALVKKLQAVEALGQTTVLAVDKTGTITLNQLMVTAMYVHNKILTIDGNGYSPEGRIIFEGKPISLVDFPDLQKAGRIASLAAIADVSQDDKTREWHVSGDPTEAALQVFGQKLGFRRNVLERETPYLDELPFDYATKIHAVLNRVGKHKVMAIVGSPEAVLARCNVTTLQRKQINTAIETMAHQGLRVVAFASKSDVKETALTHIPHLEFGGLYGIRDVLHPEVREVVTALREAHIRLVMITGDHKITARAIAADAGIFRPGDTVLTGEELKALSSFELKKVIKTTTVFARVSPQDKQAIIEAYRKVGETIAMTGDGVNDAPSLVAADLGISMGQHGTEVAKEASDIILLDDNLKSVVAAVEEGRNIYRTIQKVILYLFSTSLGEVFVIVGALVFSLPLVITASQIIWLNFVTDGFLTIALALEPREVGLLKERWKPSQLVTGRMFRRMVLMGLVMLAGTLLVYPTTGNGADSRLVSSMVLTLLAAIQWFNAWNCRHEYESVFSRHSASNPWLFAMTALVVLLQLAALHVPFLQTLLHTQPLSLSQWAVIVAGASFIIWTEELLKFFRRAGRPKP